LIVLLGSIPELPAKSCKEIKASEGGQADSRTYWLDSIKPGLVIQLYCNMETEGKQYLKYVAFISKIYSP